MKKIISALIALVFSLGSCVYSSALGVKAAAAVLFDKATGEVLYEKNSKERMSIASTTKIMTAIIVIENADLSATHTVSFSESAVEGSALGIKAGDKISVKNLLHGLMIVSGNDASFALATATSGTVEAFVGLMNKKARQLNLANTHFTNPAGLSDDEHYSSAYDLAKLTSYALDNPIFSQLCSLKDYKLTLISPKKSIYLHNHNRLLSEYSGCIGVKTGYTERAGRCLVSAAKRNSQVLIAVTLNDGDDWKDHKKMLDFGFASSVEYVPDFSKVRINVVGGNKGNIALFGKTKIYIPKKCLSKVRIIICSDNHFLYAPVKKNETVGVARIVYNSAILTQIKLCALESVDFKTTDN